MAAGVPDLGLRGVGDLHLAFVAHQKQKGDYGFYFTRKIFSLILRDFPIPR